jgi:hypothetical protein
MTWGEKDWAAYNAWLKAWIEEHEHEFPRHVQTENGRVPLSNKHRWRFAYAAWREMRQQMRAAERRAAKR